jgi:hypothetical protein
MSTDTLPFSAAAQRNQGPLREVLAGVLPATASVLEIACGTGQHAAHCAAAQPGWTWQPTDAQAGSLQTTAARCAHLPNVRPPLLLDVLAPPWPAGLGPVDAVMCVNMLHVAPWAACAALMHCAAQHLRDDGWLFVYGPFIVAGEALAPGNAAFDADLRARHAAWGLRELADVVQQAQAAGLAFERRVAMPANNLTLLFRRMAAAPSEGPTRG